MLKIAVILVAWASTFTFGFLIGNRQGLDTATVRTEYQNEAFDRAMTQCMTLNVQVGDAFTQCQLELKKGEQPSDVREQ